MSGDRVFTRLARDGAGVLRAITDSGVGFTFEAEWREAFDKDKRGNATGALTPSPRSTTSSRRPGVAITGTVWTRNRRVVACEKCHQLRVDLGGPHGPQAHADGSQTDCVGDVVRPARAEAA